MRGAKGKYNPEIVKEICDHVFNGATQRDAALMSDITEETFYTWLKEHPEFSESVKKAHAKYKEQLVSRVKKASDKSWQAAAWILERRYKEDYALRQEITGKDGEPLPSQTYILPDGSKIEFK